MYVALSFPRYQPTCFMMRQMSYTNLDLPRRRLPSLLALSRLGPVHGFIDCDGVLFGDPLNMRKSWRLLRVGR